MNKSIAFKALGTVLLHNKPGIPITKDPKFRFWVAFNSYSQKK